MTRSTPRVFIHLLSIAMLALTPAGALGEDGNEVPDILTQWENFRINRIENDAVNLLLRNPGLLIADHVDLNQDGRADELDLLRWREQVTSPELNEHNRVVSFAYNAVLDVNADGLVNVLDFDVLKYEVARILAVADETLMLDGDLVDPARTIVAFDGIVVTTTTTEDPPVAPRENANDGLDEIEREKDEELMDDDDTGDCTPETESNPPYPDLQHWGDDWFELRSVCGGLLYYVDLKVDQVVTGPVFSQHLGCGIEGPTVVTYSVSITTETTMKAEVGAALGRPEFGLEFGISWEQSSSTTVTTSVASTFTSELWYDDTFQMRYYGFSVNYKATPTEPCSVPIMTPPPIEESGIIRGMYAHTKRKRRTCCDW